MFRRLWTMPVLVVLVGLSLAGCQGGEVASESNVATEVVLRVAGTLTAVATRAGPTRAPTATPIPSPTPSPTRTPTPTPFPKLNLRLLGCDAGPDQTIDAYVVIVNVGNAEATHVTLTLSVSDEGQPHPEKVQEVAYLPPDYVVRERLTANTSYRSNTAVTITLTTAEGQRLTIERPSCRQVDPEALTQTRALLGVLTGIE